MSDAGAELLKAADTQFLAARDIFYQRVQSHQLMCRIYQAYAGPNEANHNCLGCNFDDLTSQIQTLLKLFVDGSRNHDVYLHHYVAMYALAFNSLWERIRDVFAILSVPESYRERHYKPLVRVRRWANFFKHPKEFGWLVHHPNYTIEGTRHAQEHADPKLFKIIDDEFLKKYYTSDQDKGLVKELSGFERRVVVVFPNVEVLTTQICDCLDRFVKIVTENPVYVEILNDKSTIINFFERGQRVAEEEAGKEG